MLTTSCIMCGGKISWNAVACPHCGDPGPELRAKLRREQGYSSGPVPVGQHVINGFFNGLIGMVVLGAIAVSVYLMSRLF